MESMNGEFRPAYAMMVSKAIAFIGVSALAVQYHSVSLQIHKRMRVHQSVS